MRPYRGRRLDNKKWVLGWPLQAYDGRVGIVTAVISEDDGVRPFSIYEVDPATVGQSTGKLGKNKNLIYAGDLVRDTQRGAWAKGYVLWDEENARFKVDNPGLYDCMGRKFEWSDLEVIGNVHNKEKNNDTKNME